MTTEETDCPNSPEDVPLHCEHWYDCLPCCWCGDDPPHDPDADECDNPAHQPFSP